MPCLDALAAWELWVPMYQIKVFNAGGGNEVLEPTQSYFNPGALTLLHLRQELQHHYELWIPHVVLRDEDAEGGPASEPPETTDKLKLGPDIVGQQRHVVGQVEIRT